METHRHAPWLAFSAGALLVAIIAWMVPSADAPVSRNDPDRPKVEALLAQLEQECDPDSPWNDYASSSKAPPTERHRRMILEQLHGMSAVALAEVKARLENPPHNEFGQMLIVLAAAFGDATKVIPAARLMAYSEHPAVRLCAARELAKLRDPLTIEWFEYAATHDDRCVRNDDRGSFVEYFYPVRAVAGLALKDFGLERQGWSSLSAER
jgi:hypothetical protein